MTKEERMEAISSIITDGRLIIKKTIANELEDIKDRLERIEALLTRGLQ